jgi:hypothetical protein
MLSAAAAYSSNMELLQVLVHGAGALGSFMLAQHAAARGSPARRRSSGNSGSALLAVNRLGEASA